MNGYGLRVPLVTFARARVHFFASPKGLHRVRALLVPERPPMGSGGWGAIDSIIYVVFDNMGSGG